MPALRAGCLRRGWLLLDRRRCGAARDGLRPRPRMRGQNPMLCGGPDYAESAIAETLSFGLAVALTPHNVGRGRHPGAGGGGVLLGISDARRRSAGRKRPGRSRRGTEDSRAAIFSVGSACK